MLQLAAAGLSFHREAIIMMGHAPAGAERFHAEVLSPSGVAPPFAADADPHEPRHRLALHAVARDQTSAIVIAPGGGGLPAWSGTGDWDYVCGSCAAMLCAGVASERTFPSLVFRCVCGVLNRSS